MSPAMGRSEWKSPYKLWAEKTGLQQPEDLSNNESIIFGNYGEPIVAKEYARRNGVKLLNPNKTRKHPKCPILFGTADRILSGQRKGLECKWVGERSKGWTSEADGIPPDYIIQCQAYMEIYDFEEWDLAVVQGGNRYRQYSLQRDHTLGKIIVASAFSFWQLVTTHTPPAMRDTLDTKERYGQAIPTFDRQASGEILETLKKYNDAVRRAAAFENIAASYKTMLQEYLGECERLLKGDEVLVTWLNQERTTIDSSLLKKLHPAVYTEVSRLSKSRPFVVKEAK